MTMTFASITHDDRRLNKMPPAYLPPVFWIQPVDGRARYRVDLTALAEGFVSPSGNTLGFEGRPGFAYAFGRWLATNRPSEAVYRAYSYGLRTFLRFLQHADPEGLRMVPEFITEEIGPHLKEWLRREGLKNYALVRSVVENLRPDEYVPLVWPTVSGNDPTDQSKEIFRHQSLALYTAFKEEASQIKAMFREGTELAASGRDPRGRSFPNGTRPWDVRENHAWLAREMIRTAHTDEDIGYRSSGKRITIFGRPFGPTYVSPGLPDDAGSCIGGKLRWFSFSFYDAAVFLWLFLQKTGWNLGTALSIDVSNDASWFTSDASKPDHRTIHAFKARSNAEQMVTVRADRQWHPFQIVRFMVEQTEPLRGALRRKLAAAQLRAVEDTSSELARYIAEMEAALKSPWLYHRFRNGVDPTSIKHHDSSRINKILRIVAGRHGIGHSEAGGWTTSDARDFLIQSTYEKGAMDVLGSQAVAQHASPETTGRNYLQARRFKAASEARLRLAQSAYFEAIEAERPLNPVRLKILLANGAITAEQELRLLDPAMRTRLGMGCKDPHRPPPDIAPGHPEGQLCAVQRCTGCEHGVVFEDSLDDLVRRHVVLRSIQRGMAHGSWTGSSFEAEADSVEETLKMFDETTVEAARLRWEGFVKSKGEAFVQDTFPAY